jgi:hypothetical protein
MVALSRSLIGILSLFILLAALLIGGSFAGFLGGGYMKAGVVVVILLWGTFAGLLVNAIRLANAGANDRGSMSRALLWTNRLLVVATILSPLTGLALAFLVFVGCGPLWIPSLYHWGGMVGTILAFPAFFLLPAIVRAWVGTLDGYETSHKWKWVVFMPLFVATLWGTVWLIPFLVFRGSINENDYQASNRLYKLPFPGGESTWVIQGNSSGGNHSGATKQHAWDFRRRCSTFVLAARAGTILKVTENFDGVGGDNNNEIQIKHYKDDKINGVPDGTVAFYLHIEKLSVPPKFKTVGAPVQQGDQIAKVGSVGNSLTGHIHFAVKNGTNTVPVSFTDVSDDKGIPRTFCSYTSGNRRVP